MISPTRSKNDMRPSGFIMDILVALQLMAILEAVTLVWYLWSRENRGRVYSCKTPLCRAWNSSCNQMMGIVSNWNLSKIFMLCINYI